jgi:2-polyprenyl-6-methoxyphenol hydroxylase-like FAD-dependent oxidoreductase
MERIDTDILVAGGGVAGLAATAAFAAEGFSTLCVDPVPPVTEATAEGSDLRSTAFLAPSIALLDRAGLWDRLAPHGAPLRVMRLADAGGPTGAIRTLADFEATRHRRRELRHQPAELAAAPGDGRPPRRPARCAPARARPRHPLHARGSTARSCASPPARRSAPAS